MLKLFLYLITLDESGAFKYALIFTTTALVYKNTIMTKIRITFHGLNFSFFNRKG